MFKVDVKTPERRHFRDDGVFSVNFEHISSFLLFLFLFLFTITLGMYVFVERNQINKNISVQITISFIFQFHKTSILLSWLTSKEETRLKLAIKTGLMCGFIQIR